MANTPTWDADIKNFFTQLDIGCMRQHNIDLGSYADVKNNATEIHTRVESGSMPQGGPRWTSDKVQKFQDWINAGYPES